MRFDGPTNRDTLAVRSQFQHIQRVPKKRMRSPLTFRRHRKDGATHEYGDNDTCTWLIDHGSGRLLQSGEHWRSTRDAGCAADRHVVLGGEREDDDGFSASRLGYPGM